MRRFIVIAFIMFLLSGCGSTSIGEDEKQQSVLSQTKGEIKKPTPIETEAAAKEKPEAAVEAVPTPAETEETASGENQPPTAAIDKWSLWVDGPHLRGANIWQSVVIPELDGTEFKGDGRVGPPYTQEDFDQLAAMGANYVSISGPGLFTETSPYTVDSGVQDHLDNLLAMIAEADMFATIGFRTGPGRSEFGLCCGGDSYFDGYFNDTVWEDQAAQDAWVEMWRYTAQRYGNNPIVAGYKLMVEPNSSGAFFDIYDPDEFYAEHAGTLYDWNQFYPRLVAGIREVDADTPILVGGNGWSGVDWLPYLQPTGDPRMVYIVHQYEPQDDYTHQEPDGRNSYPGVWDADYDGEDDEFNRAWLDNFLSPVDEFSATHNVPVAVDEYGVNRWVPGAAEFMDDQMDLFEQRGMNQALWEWQTSWKPFADDVNDMTYRFGPNPENRTEVPNDLMDVITKYWARNTVRPSNLADAPAPAIPVGNVPLPPAGHIYHGVYPGEAIADSKPPPEDGIPFEEDGLTLDDLRSYEQHVGKTAAWVYFSHNWFRERSFPLSTVSWIRDAGSIPYIRLMLRSSSEQNVAELTFTLDRIINGDFDDDLHTWAREARDFGSPLIVEYGTEVNGEWFAWNGIWNGAGTLDGYGDPAEYDGPERFRNAYRHIIQIAREEGASNITWVFHADAHDIPDEEWNRLELYYPGNEWIDWLGVSVYGALDPTDDEWLQFRDGMDAVYPRLTALSPDKPIVLLEFGVASGNPLGDQAEWTEAALTDLIALRWPRLIGFSWWNEFWENDDDPSHNSILRVQDNPDLAAVFQELVSSEPKVLGRVSQPAPGRQPMLPRLVFTVTYETRPDEAVRLTDPTPDVSDQNPAFSPDGAQLLFTRFENGYNEGPSTLNLLNLSGGDVSLLNGAPDSDSVNLPGSSWNAVTDRITFASDREDSDEVWTMAADGSNLFRVTDHAPAMNQTEEMTGYFLEPSFSPEGQWIVFEVDPHAPEEQQQGSIWKVRADGTDLTQLTNDCLSPPQTGGTKEECTDDRQPNWSPSDDRILFQRRALDSDDWNLYTMAPDGSDIRPVTTSPSSDTDASWSPDGSRIVYSSDYGDLPVPNIFVIPTNGGEPIRVTRDETRYDGAPSWSPDGSWIAFESHPGDEDMPSALWLTAAPVVEQETAPPFAGGHDVFNWFYMIDVNLEPEMVEQIAASEYDMVVLDFIPSEENNTDYPMADVIAQLHNAPNPKLVIAYIDIGQAEEFRTYWQPGWGIGNPEWIVANDPDGWEGNFPVAYWHNDWRDIWLEEDGYLQAIVDAGFDGVYLDWVEAYSDENIITAAQKDGVDPQQEMIWWVGDIAEFTQTQNLDFVVIAQNAAELAEDDEYLDTIDAIAQEQVWFDGSADNDPPGDCPLPRTEADVDTEAYRESLSPKCRHQYEEFPDSTLHVSSEGYLHYLTMARDKGEKIFTIDYALEPENVAWVYETSRGLGFVPFVSNRALDQFVAPETDVAAPESDWWQPAVNTTWQWQLAQTVDPSFKVDMYDIELFDNDSNVVADLQSQGKNVVCYISAGSWEEWRPDADKFPASVIGKDYEGWPGEKWLDIRQIDLLAPIMQARLDECRAKGFDGIEPDNIDSYTNDTGFPLTYEDQLDYNIWLANEAHARGLSIGLKNDPDQVTDLLPYFDWALTEDCFYQDWCEDMLPFIDAGKPVFAAEYTDTGITTEQFCRRAKEMNFSAILKNRELDVWLKACR